MVVFEIDSSGQLQWFKHLSATYGILVGLFLLCTIPDWKEFFFCSAVFMRVAVQKSLWTLRISVENKQINHPRYYLLLFGSVPAEFFQMPNCHTCLYWSMQIPKGSLWRWWTQTLLGGAEIMVRGNVSGCNRRKSRHEDFFLFFSPWARSNIRSCLERM